MKSTRSQRLSVLTAMMMAVSLFGIGSAPAALDADREFEFASGLVDLGFPDFAEKVVELILKERPTMKDRAPVIDAEILISRRKFAEAEEMLAQLPADSAKTQAIRLTLALAYYRYGEKGKANEIFETFFSQFDRIPTDPDLARRYRDAAYQHAQILADAGDYANAVKAYDRYLATKPDKSTERQILSRQADLLVRAAAAESSWDKKERYLTQTKEICDKIQWGGLDVWFGNSIVALANVELVRNQPDKAESVIRSNIDILKQVDEMLKEAEMPMSISPMAGARFLLGELYEEKGQRLVNKKNGLDPAIQTLAKALSEFYNVFAKYPDSDWGPEAGVRAKALVDQLEGLGKTVNIDLGGHADKAASGRFKLADTFFTDKKYAEAIDEYIASLSEFPESDPSARSLKNLAVSYINTEDDLSARMTALYLAERFGGNDDVPKYLLSIAKKYYDLGKEAEYTTIYETYLQYFPKHELAATVLYNMAGQRLKNKDLIGAEEYYRRIIENYPKDKYFLKALEQLAWQHYKAEEFEKAAEYFESYVKASRPGYEKARSQFSMADAYVRQQKFAQAVEAYETLIKWIAPSSSQFNQLAEDAKKNKEYLSKSIFQRGFCYSRLNEPAEKVKEYRATAIKAYEQYVKLYPKTDLAPAALSAQGALQLELGQNDEAATTFDRLATDYPESEQGQNALFSLIRSAMEIELYDQAKIAFDKMLKNADTFTPDQFLRVGKLMLDAGLYDQSILALRRVMGSTKDEDRDYVERALSWAGEAYFKMKNYERAIKATEELMTRYPKSGLFYDAKFVLGISYRETGELKQATDALSDILRYTEDEVLRNRAQYELGLIQEAQEDYAPSFASFLRVALFADPNNKDQRPIIEKCILKGIDVGTRIGHYDDVVELCDQYLKQFPRSDRIEEIRKLRGAVKLKAAAAVPAQATAVPAGGGS